MALTSATQRFATFATFIDAFLDLQRVQALCKSLLSGSNREQLRKEVRIGTIPANIEVSLPRLRLPAKSQARLPVGKQQLFSTSLLRITGRGMSTTHCLGNYTGTAPRVWRAGYNSSNGHINVFEAFLNRIWAKRYVFPSTAKRNVAPRDWSSGLPNESCSGGPFTKKHGKAIGLVKVFTVITRRRSSPNPTMHYSALPSFPR
ncbi:hypothetical protein F5Y05DRAFT_23265 [Hypoxylon sp. FL0543]|nr:hypothetical protein F5Y05DRAFT_23265 [Hypoxylon sp. FL0543]